VSTNQTRITVRFCETDLMGIVHHANYLQYFEVGRVEWLKERGFSYEKWMAAGLHLPVVEANVRYRKAARFDDELVIETRVVETTRVTLRFGYVVRRDDVVIAEGDTLLACVDDRMIPRRLPKEITSVLATQ
jgi:acyl-CoA thioester hydrolase